VPRPDAAADRRSAADRGAGRTSRQRAADHAAIDRLADELVPALMAKLGSTNLGEIEVREGDWRVRLRRAAGGVNYGRRATDKPSRAHPGHEGHGHAPAALDGHRASGGASPGGSPANPGKAGAAAGLAAVGPGRGSGAAADPPARDRTVATSPAVGVFQPAANLSSGTRVRTGDRLGVVDMLGVPHEVLAPADGVVGVTLVEAGHAVEYGQELIRIETAGGSRDASGSAGREAGA
jgi:acetyl-CoA carboxylase biotin carboxyl carrier protein